MIRAVALFAIFVVAALVGWIFGRFIGRWFR